MANKVTEPSNDKIRVVMFGSGPRLNHDANLFLCALEDHPEIEFLGAFCQAKSQSIAGVFNDLWNRRRFLAFPLFIVWFVTAAMRFLWHPLAEIALRNKLNQLSNRIHYIETIHAKAVLDQVSALQPDLGLIYGSPILKPELFCIPKMGTLGIHHGKLPGYRGNKTTFWSMYNEEASAGVTIQKINEGLDTGYIVKEGEVLIGQKTYSVVVQELEALGLEIFIQAILEVKNGTATIQPQPATKGNLYRNPKPEDIIRFYLKYTQKRLGKILQDNSKTEG